MSTHSTDGRPWATLSTLKPGDKLQADPGFTCIRANDILTIQGCEHGLFVPCSEGKHFLDGQADDGEHLVGFWQA